MTRALYRCGSSPFREWSTRGTENELVLLSLLFANLRETAYTVSILARAHSGRVFSFAKPYAYTRVGKTRRGTASLCPCTFWGAVSPYPRGIYKMRPSLSCKSERRRCRVYRVHRGHFSTDARRQYCGRVKRKREGTALLFPPLQINMYSTYSAYGLTSPRVSPVNVTFVAC